MKRRRFHVHRFNDSSPLGQPLSSSLHISHNCHPSSLEFEKQLPVLTPSMMALLSLPPLHSIDGCRQRPYCRKSGSFTLMAKFELKPLPYPLNALEPHMSRETLEYHWGKHHRGYVDNLNKQIAGTELDGMSLEDLLIISYNKGNFLPAFNNVAQVWNHDFFWESMKPNGGGKPSGDLLAMIKRDFGSFEGFVAEFLSAASNQFGSGWAWLTYKANRLDVPNAINPFPSEEDKKLVVVKSPNAVNPLVWDYSPILTIDVWEHAYYLNFENCRADYVSTFLEKLVSWDSVNYRLERAKARAAERERKEEEKRKQADEAAEDDETDPEQD